VPTRSLWVGNVDPGLSSQDLVAQFGKYGRVESLRLLPDKECAFVNFLRVEDAVRAREAMHAGARIGGNTVRVGFGKGEAHATGDAQAMQPTRALWIGNIAAAAAAEQLGSVFARFGEIESARVLNHKNCGFVNFVRLEDAVRAKQAMNGKSIDGAVVRIGYAKVPPAKTEAALKLRNPVPAAAPLTASGARAEAAASCGTTQRGLGSDGALEPGVSLAVNEDLVAFPYAPHLPQVPPPAVVIRADGDSSPGRLPQIPQARLRELRRQLDAAAVPRDTLECITAELLPHAVDLCTDYVGNVLVQRMAERGSPSLRLELVRRIAPHMAAIGVHKNGTWAVQKLIDCADAPAQRRLIVRALRPYVPQLLLDQLGNYVVQGCLGFGAPTDSFVFDAIHARCLDVAQGRFGARAVRTCLESPHASRMQQKLVAVSLVTNAAALATNANGHLLMNWLLDSSRFAGRFRVLAHQLAPHLRYLATHKLGASTVTKLVDQSHEPDARDLILNTLFYNPDPTVLADVLADQSQGVHVVLRVLQGSAIGDAEKTRLADRLRPVL
ncbi:ARM repeat-containing protein, partial [Coemansia reversa NRRL 1564]